MSYSIDFLQKVLKRGLVLSADQSEWLVQVAAAAKQMFEHPSLDNVSVLRKLVKLDVYFKYEPDTVVLDSDF